MSIVLEGHPEMSDNLVEFAVIPRSIQEHLAGMLAPSAQGHEFAALCRSWQRALSEGAYISKPDQVSFQVFESADPSTTLIAVLKRSKFEDGKPWMVTYAGKDTYGTLKDAAAAEIVQAATPPSNVGSLKDYAFIWLGEDSAVLKEIASLARPEPWGFSANDYSVLYNYIVQTFYKLRTGGLVLEAEDRTFAAMNTGLITPRYEDIYLCFKPNSEPDAQPWAYAGACTQYDNREKAKQLSSQLRDTFPAMPQRARFFSDVGDIVFDASKKVVCNWGHIIAENIDRIPIEFIVQQLDEDEAGEIIALVESIDYDPDKGSIADPFGDHARGDAGEKFGQLRDFLNANPPVFNRIRDRMEGALSRTIKRAEHSFRIGVPSFYPAINKIQILLPLCLMDEDKPDCALVASKDDWGNYEGRTILTPRMAYSNARLLCRPEPEWLSV